MTEWHEKRSVIITTNLGFADWTQIFGDPTMTAALLDRLTHKTHIVGCAGIAIVCGKTLNKHRHFAG